jgi:hypothetical protein
MSFLAFHQALQHLGFKQTTIHGTQYVHMLGLKADKLRDEPDEQ